MTVSLDGLKNEIDEKTQQIAQLETEIQQLRREFARAVAETMGDQPAVEKPKRAARWNPVAFCRFVADNPGQTANKLLQLLEAAKDAPTHNLQKYLDKYTSNKAGKVVLNAAGKKAARGPNAK